MRFQAGRAIEVAIEDFQPDNDPTAAGILLDAFAATPSSAGFRSRNTPAQYAPALAAPCLGGYVALFSTGVLKVYAATATNIYRLDAGAWVSVGGPYAVTQRWRFTQFLDDVIAFNGDLVAPQVAAGSASNFGNLGGGPPNNMFTGISVGGVLVGYVGSAWANSAAGTDNNWTPNVQTQAGTGTLYDYPGNIVAAASFFRQQIVWKAASMYSLYYIGQDTIWQNQMSSNATGAQSQESVVIGPEAVYFIGNDDFYQTQGGAPQRIPNYVRRWFFNNADPNYLSSTMGWFDPLHSVVYWHFVSINAPFPGIPDTVLSYNVRTPRWGVDHLNATYVFPNTQPGLTSGLYFDESNVLQSWTGAPAQMGLLTGYYGNPSKMSQALKWRAKYQDGMYPSSEQVTPLSTYVLGQTPTALAQPPALTADAYWAYRETNKYHQIHLLTEGPTEVVGWAYEARESGTR